MKTVFADTGYWKALLDPTDRLHPRAQGFAKKLKKTPQVTTEMVLDETLARLRRLSSRQAAMQGINEILVNPKIEVVPQTPDQFERAFQLYQARKDKEWSLTDCASFELMWELGLQEALAHDHHFVQAGFVALLRDDSEKAR